MPRAAAAASGQHRAPLRASSSRARGELAVGGMEGVAEGPKGSPPDRRPHVRHQRFVVPQVVQCAEDRRQHLVAAIQVPQVRAAVAVAAGVATAPFLDRTQVRPVLCVADADDARPGEEVPVARVARRHHAVEHVDTARHRLDQVLRPPDAHQVTGAIDRQLWTGMFEHRVSFGLGFTDGQATDRVAVEPDRLEALERLRAQRMMHATLDDAEQRRVVAFVRAPAAFGPAQAELHRCACDVFRRRIRRALVEDHDDVRLQHALDAHAFLGSEEHGRSIGRRGEGDAGLGDLPSMCQREHLEAARIGEDRAAPASESVQPSVRLDDVEARTQVQMEGVAEDDLGTQRAQLLRQHALDRAVGAHRHESRGLDGAAREREAAAARGAVGGEQFEGHPAHAACPTCGNSNIASPYEKNRYRSRIACSYAAKIRSRPANAETSISNVLSGRWKLVSSASMLRTRTPGRMKMLVSPANGWSSSPTIALSNARTTVVPTATTRWPRSRVRRTFATSSEPTFSHSLCIRCSSRSSTRTGWNVPAPTWSVTWPESMPRSFSASSSASSKCRPAVGAATAPGSRANTVW